MQSTSNNKPPTQNAGWFTWEKQVRNSSASTALNLPLFELTVEGKGRISRYATLLIRTSKIILKNNFSVLFAQNPSIVLALFICLLSKLTGKKSVIDAHNGGLFPLEGKSKFLNFFARKTVSLADFTIVTNENLAGIISKWHGRPLILPDPLPALPPVNKVFSPTKRYCLFICTWARDEPYLEVLKAASAVKDQLDIYVTGNYKKQLSQTQINSLSKNIKLLGFVREEDYVRYLRAAMFTIDLTHREDCLVCGAYESMAAEVPSIVSDTNVSREVFSKGFVYSKNTTNEITNSINYTIKNIDNLKTEIIEQKKHHIVSTEKYIDKIKASVFGSDN